MTGFLLNQNLEVVCTIGSGAFGDVYGCRFLDTDKSVAVKVEDRHLDRPTLPHEANILKLCSGSIGVPRLFNFSTDMNHRVLVEELLGRSLTNLRKLCGGKFTIKTILMLADQMISRLEYLHKKSIIHRDIKPENFLMGRGNSRNVLYLIDFGLAKRYRDADTHDHIPERKKTDLTGTARWVSVNTHLRIEQSRRDDMESLAYLFSCFFNGTLPWEQTQGDTSKKREQWICQQKAISSIDSLCKGMPDVFNQYFREVRSLKFNEEPKYQHYRELFRESFINLGFVYDYNYDWNDFDDLEPNLPRSSDPTILHKSLPSTRSLSPEIVSEITIGKPKYASTRRKKVIHKTPTYF